jgi:hypothetical protein
MINGIDQYTYCGFNERRTPPLALLVCTPLQVLLQAVNLGEGLREMMACTSTHISAIFSLRQEYLALRESKNSSILTVPLVVLVLIIGFKGSIACRADKSRRHGVAVLLFPKLGR